MLAHNSKFSKERYTILNKSLKFAISIVELSCLCLFCNTKISEFFDMTKSWAARLFRLPKQELIVTQVLKKFN